MFTLAAGDAQIAAQGLRVEENVANELLECFPRGSAKGEHGGRYVAPRDDRFWIDAGVPSEDSSDCHSWEGREAGGGEGRIHVSGEEGDTDSNNHQERRNKCHVLVLEAQNLFEH